MRFTACLAPVIMKLWDLAWLKSMNMEGITIDLYVRFVDDSRIMLRPLNPGWRWCKGMGFMFQKDWEQEDSASTSSPKRRNDESHE